MRQESSVSQMKVGGQGGGRRFFSFFSMVSKSGPGMHIALLIEVWITDQNSKPQEIEDKININLVIF